MSSLSPPAPNRHRASSTNICPPLTLSTLGSRRRSNSLLDTLPRTPSPPPSSSLPDVNVPSSLAAASSTPPLSPSPPTMLSAFLSRSLHLLHIFHPHSPPPPSSPRLSRASTSSDDTLLPIASPIRSSFPDPLLEKLQPPLSRPWSQHFPSVHAPVLLVITSFPLSAALVLFAASTLPITMQWPRNLTDLAQLGRELVGYSESGLGPLAHVVGVISAMAVWMHAWSVPGSVIVNVLAGALFSPVFATLLMTMLTTAGSIFASLLSAPLAPFLVSVFPRALSFTRLALEGPSPSPSDPTLSPSKTPPWIRLSILRLVGIIPWSGINIACGVCGVSITDCILGGFIGSLPWTAVTCQIGDILQTVASNPSPTPRTVQSLLASPEIIAKLVFLSFLSLAPILGRDRLRAWLSSSGFPSNVPALESVQSHTPRWAAVKEWATRLALPSLARPRGSVCPKELDTLVREKNASLPL